VAVDEKDKDTVGDCRFDNGCRTGPRQNTRKSLFGQKSHDNNTVWRMWKNNNFAG
jgi:hypothetical protein